MPRKTQRTVKPKSRDSSSDNDLSQVFKDRTNIQVPTLRMSLRKNRKRRLFFDEESPLSDKSNETNTPRLGKENQNSTGKLLTAPCTVVQTPKGAFHSKLTKTCVYKCRFSELNGKLLNPEEKLALYEFQFNENEMPKKRKRKPAVKKPKVNPKVTNCKSNASSKDSGKCVAASSKNLITRTNLRKCRRREDPVKEDEICKLAEESLDTVDEIDKGKDLNRIELWKCRRRGHLKEDEICKLAEEPLDTVDEIDEGEDLGDENLSLKTKNLSNRDVSLTANKSEEKVCKRIPFNERIKKFNISLESPHKTSPKNKTFHKIRNKTVYCSTPNNTAVKPQKSSENKSLNRSKLSTKSVINGSTSTSSPKETATKSKLRKKSFVSNENVAPTTAPSHNLVSSTPYTQDINLSSYPNIKRQNVLDMAMSTVNRIRRAQKSLYVGPTPYVNFNDSLEDSFTSREAPEDASKQSFNTASKCDSAKPSTIISPNQKVNNISNSLSGKRDSPVHQSKLICKDKNNGVCAEPVLTEEKASSVSTEVENLIEMKSAEEEISRCFGFAETKTKDNPYILLALQQMTKPWRVNFANVRSKNMPKNLSMSLIFMNKSYLQPFGGNNTLSYIRDKNISGCSSIDSFSISNILSANQSNISMCSTQINTLDVSSCSSILDKDMSKQKELHNLSNFKDDAFKKPSLPPSRPNSVRKHISKSDHSTKQEDSQPCTSKNVSSSLFKESNNLREPQRDLNQRTLDELYFSVSKNAKSSSYSGKLDSSSGIPPDVDFSETATSDLLDETSVSTIAVTKPRLSYERRKRCRQMSQTQDLSDDEEDENKELQPKKKNKKEKKEERMMNEWAKSMNSELEEADSFELCVE